MDAKQKALDIALGALADIAMSQDMTLDLARKKAKRIYDECQKLLGIDANDDEVCDE